jgi:hypothetical protein
MTLTKLTIIILFAPIINLAIKITCGILPNIQWATHMPNPQQSKPTTQYSIQPHFATTTLKFELKFSMKTLNCNGTILSRQHNWVNTLKSLVGPHPNNVTKKHALIFLTSIEILKHHNINILANLAWNLHATQWFFCGKLWFFWWFLEKKIRTNF